MRALQCLVVWNENCRKKQSSQSSKQFCPILTYRHESWMITKRVQSQAQAPGNRFLRRIEGVALFNKVRSSEIQKSLNIEPLPLWIEWSKLTWFGHESRMPLERLPKQALLAKAKGKRSRTTVNGPICVEDLGWNCVGLHPIKMMEMVEDREMWVAA